MRGLIDKIKAQLKGKAAGPALFLGSLWVGCFLHWLLPEFGAVAFHMATFITMVAGMGLGGYLTGRAFR